ncbi:unnamed protein product [Diamesa tonsa]
MPFGRKSPLEALVITPASHLACKYNQFRARRREAQSRRVTERELSNLHNKIEKLLSKLEESELEQPTSQEDECVICIQSRATMKTMPCGHQVVCRRCFVKTIQSAVAQRLLPLRCVICRARINRLTSSSGTWRLQESASSYSMGSKSWSVPGSASSYSVGANSYTMGERVSQSDSLYSMSSGSSNVSGYSNVSSNSGSKSSNVSVSSSTSSAVEKNHPHTHSSSCSTSGCLGAIPRNPSYSHSSHFRNKGQHSFRHRIPELPTITEYSVRSPVREKEKTRHRTPSPVNTGVRFKNYTSSNSLNPSETAPLLGEASTSTASASKTPKLGMNSKVAPIISKATIMTKTNTSATSIKPSTSNFQGFKPYVVTSTPNSKTNQSSSKSSVVPQSASSKMEEKKDNKKNESLEKKKREEKLKQKADKEAKKEEKRLAKEEEKITKMMAKEEKKRGKKEAKALLVAA